MVETESLVLAKDQEVSALVGEHWASGLACTAPACQKLSKEWVKCIRKRKSERSKCTTQEWQVLMCLAQKPIKGDEQLRARQADCQKAQSKVNGKNATGLTLPERFRQCNESIMNAGGYQVPDTGTLVTSCQPFLEDLRVCLKLGVDGMDP